MNWTTASRSPLVLAGLLHAITCNAMEVPEEGASPFEQTLYVGPGTAIGGLFRLDLQSPSVAEEIIPVSLVNTSTGIAIDDQSRQLYWIADTQSGSVDKIRRSALDGSNIELFLTPAGQPADIEIDAENSLLYWSERFTNSINVIGLDGTGQRELITVVEPRGIDLDLVNGHIYWTEFGDDRIRRANLDGTGIQDILATGIERPFDITIDVDNDRLYWVQLGPERPQNGSVWTATLSGANPTLIADQQGFPTDLIIDDVNNSILWGGNGQLLRANLDGSNVTVLSTPRIGYRNLALFSVPIPESGTLSLFAACGIALLPLVRCR